MNKLLILIVSSFTLLSGCTDTTKASISAYGNPHYLVCYNYTQKIYEGTSTGRISYDEHSISFEDKNTHELVEIILGQSSTCISKVK